jgi:hypothetical protein
VSGYGSSTVAGSGRIAAAARTSVPEIVPTAKPGSLEDVADHLAQWVIDTGDAVAAALLDSGVAPFAAPVTAEESARYYAELLYTPNGLPNAAAWQAEYTRTGALGLRESVEGAVRYRLSHGLPVLGPPEVLAGQAPPPVPPVPSERVGR